MKFAAYHIKESIQSCRPDGDGECSCDCDCDCDCDSVYGNDDGCNEPFGCMFVLLPNIKKYQIHLFVKSIC